MTGRKDAGAGGAVIPSSAEELDELIENGVREVFSSESYRDYMRTMSQFHSYSFRNTLLILKQRPGATVVAGYEAWKRAGRQVQRGERGIKILCPCRRTYEHEVVDEQTGQAKVERRDFISGFRVGHVFDLSQTEGEPLPTLARVLEFPVERFAEVRDALVASAPVPVSFAPTPAGTNGFFSRDSGGRIVVRDGMPQLQTLKTLAHEIAHSILHCEGGVQQDAPRGTKEVQAESVAFAVCERLGLDTSDYSFGYIAMWAEDKGLEELKSSLEVIQATADAILSKVDPALGVDSRGPKSPPPLPKREREKQRAAPVQAKEPQLASAPALPSPTAGSRKEHCR